MQTKSVNHSALAYASIMEGNTLYCNYLLISLSLPPECELDCRDYV